MPVDRDVMPSASTRRTCASTQSSTVTTGKSLPYARPFAAGSGFGLVGPVEPLRIEAKAHLEAAGLGPGH